MPPLPIADRRFLKSIPHDRHAVIEASAGTGKTYAIEYLVLDLLLNTECSIEEILVVTFTEKATAELRTRIRELLENVLSGSASVEDRPATDLVEIDDEGKRKLETALFSFDRAPICTIHAFLPADPHRPCLRHRRGIRSRGGRCASRRFIARSEAPCARFSP